MSDGSDVFCVGISVPLVFLLMQSSDLVRAKPLDLSEADVLAEEVAQKKFYSRARIFAPNTGKISTASFQDPSSLRLWPLESRSEKSLNLNNICYQDFRSPLKWQVRERWPRL